MGYQVDYVPVGDGERSGDAIAIRYGDLKSGDANKQTVVVIDGGTKKSGAKLVEHIKTHYGTEKADYVFSTHLDSDHLSGITEVLENLEVGTLYMHVPWEHLDETNALFSGDFTNEELEQKLKKSLDLVHEVESLAIEKGIPVEEPFRGTRINGELFILGPSKEYYEELLVQFRETPDAKKSMVEIALQQIRKAEEALVNWVEDSLDIDLLGDAGETSPENNSSLVLLMAVDGKKLLFTGDAGIPALTQAVDHANNHNVILTDLSFFHIPHHGSKHNIGSSLLKRLHASTAYASASEADPKHPYKVVTNALYKNGFTRIHTTRGNALLHHHDDIDRGWTSAVPLPFYKKVEA